MTDLTGLIITYNEQENIGRTLAALSWLPEILILDSFSTDDTCRIASEFANVRVEQRRFDTHANQWNFGLQQTKAEWVLTLDADYIVPAPLGDEIRRLTAAREIAGYSAAFRYIVFGQSLRRSIYPPRVILFRAKDLRYFDEGHTQQLRVGGRVQLLANPILHDDRKPLSRWIQSQDRYAKLEAAHLLGRGASEISDVAREVENERVTLPTESIVANIRNLSLQDKLRKMIWVAPVVMPFYLLIACGLILDGWRGWYYVLQRTIAEMLLSLRLLEERLKR